jgi:hypothetical protein
MFQPHHLPHLNQHLRLGVGDDQFGTYRATLFLTVRSPGLTYLMRLHRLLKYANEARD